VNGVGETKEKAETVILRHFIKDIKANRQCYIHSLKMVKAIRAINDEIDIVFDEEENCYIATYIRPSVVSEV
jgi:hypothetical protein